MTSKNPRTPPPTLTREKTDIVEYQQALWTIHRTTGPYGRAWNTPRQWGPLKVSRWDPHEEPPSLQPDRAVQYAAEDFTTSVAEVFQDFRSIPLDPDYSVAGWVPTRPLSLLDLTGNWALRAGASTSLFAAPKSTCRAWSRKIFATWPDLDGLLVPSTMTQSRNIILFASAASSFPSAPELARSLADRALSPLIAHTSRELNWGIHAV